MGGLATALFYYRLGMSDTCWLYYSKPIGAGTDEYWSPQCLLHPCGIGPTARRRAYTTCSVCGYLQYYEQLLRSNGGAVQVGPMLAMLTLLAFNA